jgi:hypothetical protein
VQCQACIGCTAGESGAGSSPKCRVNGEGAVVLYRDSLLRLGDHVLGKGRALFPEATHLVDLFQAP